MPLWSQYWHAMSQSVQKAWAVSHMKNHLVEVGMSAYPPALLLLEFWLEHWFSIPDNHFISKSGRDSAPRIFATCSLPVASCITYDKRNDINLLPNIISRYIYWLFCCERMQFKSIQHLMCFIYVNTNITLFWEIIVIILKSFASVGIHLDHWEFTYL